MLIMMICVGDDVDDELLVVMMVVMRMMMMMMIRLIGAAFSVFNCRLHVTQQHPTQHAAT